MYSNIFVYIQPTPPQQAGFDTRSTFKRSIFIATSHYTGIDTRSDFIVGELGKGEVGHEPRLMPCYTMLVTGLPSAMRAR